MKSVRHFMLPTLKDSSHFIFPESVGWYQVMPQHDVDRPDGYHATFSLHFIIGGRGYVEIDGKVHTMQKGDAFLYFPTERQRYYSSQDDPWNVRWVHFYGYKLQEFLIEKGFHHTLWTLKRWGELEEAYDNLLLEAEANNILRQSRLSSLCYTILVEFMSYAVSLSANRGTDAADRIVQLLSFMQQQACQPFVLEEWATRAGVSPHYFCKLFRQTTTMTPLSFITLCRIQTAKQWLIEHPARPVKEIAEQAGYPSTSYFNQRFLEFEGVTPSEYRRRY